jgi:hypothetical protein
MSFYFGMWVRTIASYSGPTALTGRPILTIVDS